MLINNCQYPASKTVVLEATMALNPELMKTLLNDALNELAEINERKSHLDALVSNLRKCLINSSNGSLPAQDATVKKQAPKGGYHRKESHATRIFDIVTHSEIKMKPKDVLRAYRERKEWNISAVDSNALATIYRAVKERPDLLTLSDDGYILPVVQG